MDPQLSPDHSMVRCGKVMCQVMICQWRRTTPATQVTAWPIFSVKMSIVNTKSRRQGQFKQHNPGTSMWKHMPVRMAISEAPCQPGSVLDSRVSSCMHEKTPKFCMHMPMLTYWLSTVTTHTNRCGFHSLASPILLVSYSPVCVWVGMWESLVDVSVVSIPVQPAKPGVPGQLVLIPYLTAHRASLLIH